MKKFKYHQVLMIRPRAKQRPRMSKRGFAYTPKTTALHEAAIAEMYKGPLFAEGDLAVRLRFVHDQIELEIERVQPNPEVEQPVKRLRGDIDNYVKSVLDALNGVAYSDDKQIVVLFAEKA